MAYIGKTPTVGNFVKLDAITASATASYTMQVDSVNFSPESVNHMLVSLNGVIQAPTDSYTISGSTITFASALTASDSIDFIMVYGNVLDIGTPSDNTVSLAKLTATGTKDATTFLRGDNTFATVDNTPSFFVFRSGNQNISDATTTKVEFNSEVFDTDNAFDSSTNYRFTVPSSKAGKYHFSYSVSCHSLATSELEIADVFFYKNGSAVNEQSLDFRSNPVRRFCVTNSIILDLSVGDYIEVYGKIDDASGTPKFDGEATYTTYFQGFKLT